MFASPPGDAPNMLVGHPTGKHDAGLPQCNRPLANPFAACALAAFASSIFMVAWLGRLGQTPPPGTWPLRRWLVRCMLCAAVSRFFMLLLLGLLAPSGVCDGLPQLCGGLGEFGSGLAFSAAWAGTVLVLVFLVELRLAYINTESEVRGETVSCLRRCAAVGLSLGCAQAEPSLSPA